MSEDAFDHRALHTVQQLPTPSFGGSIASAFGIMRRAVPSQRMPQHDQKYQNRLSEKNFDGNCHSAIFSLASFWRTYVIKIIPLDPT